MKKVLLLFAFFLLTAASTWRTDVKVSACAEEEVALQHGCTGADMPLGDGEEKSGEEDKDVTEDDDLSLDHRGQSHDKSTISNLHILYQDKLFQGLEKEVVIPPPRA